MSHLSVILCGLAQAVRDVYSTNQNILLNPLISQHSLPPLQRENDFVYALFIFFCFCFFRSFTFFYISLLFVHRLLVCFASSWVTLRIKNTAPEARNVEQDISLTWVIQKSNTANSVRGGSTILRTKPIWPLALSEQTIIKMFHITIFLFPSKSLFCNHIVVYVC